MGFFLNSFNARGESRRKGAKGGESRRKVAKGGERWRKAAKGGERWRKPAKGSNYMMNINQLMSFLIEGCLSNHYLISQKLFNW